MILDSSFDFLNEIQYGMLKVKDGFSSLSLNPVP